MLEYQIKDDNPLMLSQRAAHELKKRVRQHELAEAAVMIAEAKNKAVETIKAETDKDILPCPFCGREAAYNPSGGYVQCVACGVRTAGGVFRKKKKEVIAIWNKRS